MNLTLKQLLAYLLDLTFFAFVPVAAYFATAEEASEGLINLVVFVNMLVGVVCIINVIASEGSKNPIPKFAMLASLVAAWAVLTYAEAGWYWSAVACVGTALFPLFKPVKAEK